MNGQTALAIFIERQSIDLIKLLLTKGFNCNKTRLISKDPKGYIHLLSDKKIQEEIEQKETDTDKLEESAELEKLEKNFTFYSALEYARLFLDPNTEDNDLNEIIYSYAQISKNGFASYKDKTGIKTKDFQEHQEKSKNIIKIFEDHGKKIKNKTKFDLFCC